MEFSLVQIGESMRNIQSLIQQSIENKDISLRFPSRDGSQKYWSYEVDWDGGRVGGSSLLASFN